MFAAVDEALARLYPTRRWTERDEEAAFGAGVSPEEGAAVAQALAARLRALALYRPGTAEETCDFIYVLCLGRAPSLIERREGLSDGDAEPVRSEPSQVEPPLEELYLRVALSTVARFAGVQQVAMRGVREQGRLVITETPRTGVFDPILLKRFQALVAVLSEHDIQHLDFGEILQAPDGFDAGDYAERYGGAPAVANYFFFPQPAAAITTTVVT
jgi:hypothetical protein